MPVESGGEREHFVDRTMHELWLRAERRIDASLALIVASALWIVVLPTAVAFTDLEWSFLTTLFLLIALPVCSVALWPLKTGLMTVRAIEERDGEEVERWRETLIPPVEPELVRTRLRRVHYPMLAVIVAACVFVACVALNRWSQAQTTGMANFSLGVALGAIGGCLGGGVLMLAGKIRPRVLLLNLIVIGWTIPAGGALASVAIVIGRRDLESALAVRALTAVSYVIFGLIGMLISLLLFILWFTWVGKLFSGKSLEVNHLAREVPVLPEGHDVDLVAGPEFVVEDVEIITDALAVPGSMYVLIGATFVATFILVSVAIVGAGGTLAVAVFGMVVAVLTSLVLYRAFKV